MKRFMSLIAFCRFIKNKGYLQTLDHVIFAVHIIRAEGVDQIDDKLLLLEDLAGSKHLGKTRNEELDEDLPRLAVLLE